MYLGAVISGNVYIRTANALAEGRVYEYVKVEDEMLSWLDSSQGGPQVRILFGFVKGGGLERLTTAEDRVFI